MGLTNGMLCVTKSNTINGSDKWDAVRDKIEESACSAMIEMLLDKMVPRQTF
jgi:hypothetical protein